MESYSIPEAARATGLSPKEVRLRIEEGRLQATFVGGRRVVEKTELERAGLLGEAPADPPSPAPTPEATSKLVERLEAQAAELAVLQRASVERRTSDERERRRLEVELAETRRELQEARARVAELETAGFQESLAKQKHRPALTPLFERTPEDPPA